MIPTPQNKQEQNLAAKPRQLWIALLAGIVFSLAYSQSPLYTSNQNQYFLHGFAKAGRGFLAADWLANTRDPTPVFSLLVEMIYRISRQDFIFYLFAAVLLSVYALSLIRLARLVYPKPANSSPVSEWLFLALFITIHAAGLRFVLGQSLGYNWSYILEDGVADQRLLGPVLQPSMFGVFLPLSIVLFLTRRPVWAILAAVTAAVFHPTYLLSAGALTTAYLLVTWGMPPAEEASSSLQALRQPFTPSIAGLRKAAGLGALALLCVSPILIYAWGLFNSSPADTTAQARNILIYFRIPHHALIQEWFDATAVVKLVIFGLTLLVIRRSPVFPMLWLPGLVALLLTVVQAVTGDLALALLFPWRLSTWLVPISTTLLLRWLVVRIFEQPPFQSPLLQRILMIASLALIVLAAGAGSIRMKLDFERKITQPERAVEQYAASQAGPGQVYLTPVKMQDFRLESGLPVFVDFKSIPYLDGEVLEWYERIQLADRFYNEQDCSILPTITARGAVTHILQPALQPACPGWQQVYQDENYAIYQRVPTSQVP